ncbi:MAG: hypothetical protein H6536_04710 [Bacteroidales bacterium]|nr:hypothetical protein [Bacteroidales bacterium]
MIDKLKTGVEVKFGRKVSYQKDCNALSDNILNSIKEYISPATLRRVFGFLATNSNPSRVTLDILSRFVGYKNWEDFSENNIKNYQSNNYNAIDYWETIRENARVISHNTVERIQLKSGIEFDKTIKRDCAKERLKNLINSNSPATAIVAPGGYGKSTMLARWYLNRINKKKKDNNIILFISAQTLDQFGPTELYLEVWLMRLLGLNPDSSFLTDITENDHPTPGKFIIIIDALDEMAAQGSKLEKIFKSIVDLVDKFAKSANLKLIVSTRQAHWNLLATNIREKSNWYFTDPNVFTPDGANIPPLNHEEIQSILDNTLKERFANRVLVHEMPPDLKRIIAYPYFLQLFIKVYTPETKYIVNDQFAILSEFLKKQVYYSHYADEKSDILNQIILLSEYGSKPVMKENLKRVYPIHLKLSGNYFAAYEELLSFGIISEHTQFDVFGSFQKYISIGNEQLLGMLIVQNLIKKDQGIHTKLFKWIDNNLIDTELQAKILGILFKVAYKERITEPLIKFFEISPTALTATLKSPSIPIVLRGDNYMRNTLIPIYAKQPIARKLLFEKNIDYNHIVDSFKHHLKHYLDHSKSVNDALLANTLLAYAGFISTDTIVAISHYNLIRNANPTPLPPSIAGVWFTNQVAYEYFMGNGEPENWINEAQKFCAEYTNPDDKVDFAEMFLPILIMLNRIDLAPRFIQLCDKYTAPTHRAAVSFIFTKFYQRFVEERPINSTECATIEQIFSLTNPLQNYLLIIIGEKLRSDHFWRTNDLNTAQTCFRNALELSGIAEYKLVEVSLMQDLAENLVKLNETEKAAECKEYINSIWKVSGFKRMVP